jgi:alpha-beta hydrolase superfamily lysophospholipase
MYILLAIIILMNVVAYFHASKFTHFDSDSSPTTNESQQLSLLQKAKVLLLGVSNPRPRNSISPARPYQTLKLKSNKEIECWEIKTNDPKGTVILFHGFGGDKSGMLDKADVFLELGYNTLLVDFMGSGGSEGNQTTIGFDEAKEVKTAYEYVRSQGERNTILFGTSMGAASVMKALNDYDLKPEGIIIECPFGTMLKTVEARFSLMKLPSFPMARLLVFWGGVQNGFNAFNHNPVDYAINIKPPTLLLHGERDDKVSMQEIQQIYANLKGQKTLKIYPQATHENYLTKYKTEWTADISGFIQFVEKSPRQPD